MDGRRLTIFERRYDRSESFMTSSRRTLSRLCCSELSDIPNKKLIFIVEMILFINYMDIIDIGLHSGHQSAIPIDSSYSNLDHIRLYGFLDDDTMSKAQINYLTRARLLKHNKYFPNKIDFPWRYHINSNMRELFDNNNISSKKKSLIAILLILILFIFFLRNI